MRWWANVHGFVSRAKGIPASTSEYTATLGMPMLRKVRMMRRAISPRLATRTLVMGRREDWTDMAQSWGTPSDSVKAGSGAR